jgi:hypothetical protein
MAHGITLTSTAMIRYCPVLKLDWPTKGSGGCRSHRKIHMKFKICTDLPIHDTRGKQSIRCPSPDPSGPFYPPLVCTPGDVCTGTFTFTNALMRFLYSCVNVDDVEDRIRHTRLDQNLSRQRIN